MSELDLFLGEYNPPKPAAGERRQIGKGLSIRQNVMNPFAVVTLRYEAHPDRDPDTEVGRAWMLAEMRDMGCRRMCRNCDKPWGVDDEACPECGATTELVLSNRWKREYEIDYAAQAGSYVFDSFSRARNTCKPFPIPSTWTRYRGIDHGVRNPTACVWLAVDPDGSMWVYAEHYEAGQSVPYHAKQIHRISVAKDFRALEISDSLLRDMELSSWTADRRFIERCAKLYRTVGDPSIAARTQKDIQTVRARYLEQGIYIKLGNNSLAGLETINSMFALGQVTIFDTCENLIREIEHLVWDENTDPSRNLKEKPVDRDDHAVDALRYIVNERVPPGKEYQIDPRRPVTGEERAAEHRRRFLQRGSKQRMELNDL